MSVCCQQMLRLLPINRPFVGNKVVVCWQQTFIRLYAFGDKVVAKGVLVDNFRLAKLWCKGTQF
jgi:hypothetical protein